MLKDFDGSREHPGHSLLEDVDGYAKIESDMIFCGMVGIKDPARTEVPISIGKCVDAQIRVIVITGDKSETATAVCTEMNVFGDHLSDQDVKLMRTKLICLCSAKCVTCPMWKHNKLATCTFESMYSYVWLCIMHG